MPINLELPHYEQEFDNLDLELLEDSTHVMFEDLPVEYMPRLFIAETVTVEAQEKSRDVFLPRRQKLLLEDLAQTSDGGNQHGVEIEISSLEWPTRSLGQEMLTNEPIMLEDVGIKREEIVQDLLTADRAEQLWGGKIQQQEDEQAAFLASGWDVHYWRNADGQLVTSFQGQDMHNVVEEQLRNLLSDEGLALLEAIYERLLNGSASETISREWESANTETHLAMAVTTYWLGEDGSLMGRREPSYVERWQVAASVLATELDPEDQVSGQDSIIPNIAFFDELDTQVSSRIDTALSDFSPDLVQVTLSPSKHASTLPEESSALRVAELSRSHDDDCLATNNRSFAQTGADEAKMDIVEPLTAIIEESMPIFQDNTPIVEESGTEVIVSPIQQSSVEARGADINIVTFDVLDVLDVIVSTQNTFAPKLIKGEIMVAAIMNEKQELFSRSAAINEVIEERTFAVGPSTDVPETGNDPNEGLCLDASMPEQWINGNSYEDIHDSRRVGEDHSFMAGDLKRGSLAREDVVFAEYEENLLNATGRNSVVLNDALPEVGANVAADESIDAVVELPDGVVAISEVVRNVAVEVARELPVVAGEDLVVKLPGLSVQSESGEFVEQDVPSLKDASEVVMQAFELAVGGARVDFLEAPRIRVTAREHEVSEVAEGSNEAQLATQALIAWTDSFGMFSEQMVASPAIERVAHLRNRSSNNVSSHITDDDGVVRLTVPREAGRSKVHRLSAHPRSRSVAA